MHGDRKISSRSIYKCTYIDHEHLERINENVNFNRLSTFIFVISTIKLNFAIQCGMNLCYLYMYTMSGLHPQHTHLYTFVLFKFWHIKYMKNLENGMKLKQRQQQQQQKVYTLLRMKYDVTGL